MIIIIEIIEICLDNVMFKLTHNIIHIHTPTYAVEVQSRPFISHHHDW